MKKDNYSVDIIIPTYKPDADFAELLRMLGIQSKKPGQIIIMNTDKDEWGKYGGDRITDENAPGLCKVIHINKDEFRHGRTRNLGISNSKADYFICMTQDAVPADVYLIRHLIESLDDSVKVCYAKQIPKNDACDIEKITRKFNYPDESMIKKAEDIDKLGIKTFFASNVCCAYDRKVFDDLGGFIDETDFNEDMMYAIKLIKAGYSVKYCSDAKVMHSHNYSPGQQFRRNYDLAVSQVCHPEFFGDIKSESEGFKLVKVSAKTLAEEGKWYLIPELVFISGIKYLGYKAGRTAGKKTIKNG